MKNIITFILLLVSVSVFGQGEKLNNLEINANQNKNNQYIPISVNGRELLSNKRKPLNPRYETKGHYNSILLTDLADALSNYFVLNEYVTFEELSDSLGLITGEDGILYSGGLIKLGDDAAGVTESAVLTSDRFINQNGNNAIFVGTYSAEDSRIIITDESHIILQSVDAAAGDTARLEFSADHNAPVGSPRPFISHYPGNIPIPGNNTVVPYVIHSHYGGNPVGFNEALQSDYVYAWGINQQGFTEYDPQIGGLGMNMESYYDALDSLTGRQELHFVHYLPGGVMDGGGGRFLTYEGFENQLLGSSLSFQTGRDDVSQSSFALRTQEGVDRVVFDWGAKLVRIKNGIGIGFENGNVPAISQGGVEIVRVDASSDVAFANETYVFESSTPNIHTNGSSLSIGTDTDPILGGILITSTNNELLKLKEDVDPSGETFLITADDTKHYFGTTGGQTQVLAIDKSATANALSIGSDGSITAGGHSTGLGKYVAGGSVGGKVFTANGASIDNNIVLYAAGTAPNVYLFNTDITASNKSIGRLQNYTGDVELSIDALAAGKTGVLKFADATSNWQIGISRSSDSFFVYNGGDKLAGGTAIIEFTKTGNVKFLNLPTHADEAAAVTAGLATGTMYETATGELRIKL